MGHILLFSPSSPSSPLVTKSKTELFVKFLKNKFSLERKMGNSPKSDKFQHKETQPH